MELGGQKVKLGRGQVATRGVRRALGLRRGRLLGAVSRTL